MRTLKHRRPSAALVISCLALFVALGGVGYAAATIGSGDIKNNSVRSKDLRNNNVAGKDIRNGTIRSKDINKKTRSALRGKRGPRGATGATGAAGTARAYAKVNANGTVDTTQSKGITSANVAVNGGIYGFRNLGFTPRSVVTTPSFQGAGVSGAVGAGGGSAFIGDCTFVAGVDQACVAQNTDADDVSEARAFYVVFN